ncbi:U3 snoRNP protein [Trapelia coarctata]|nr:U3 snoRNP protein [Trapelia coarctata]
MAGASDKARFYLEQSIPELHELERKKCFTKDEISSIAKKRSDFEHKLSARGSHPSDYARYAEYEMNLDSLRRKRAKRMGIKAAAHSGQKRISFILERATRKFHGDIGLWMQYLEYSKQQKAYKKVAQIFTSLLRLHPTKPELWIMAAKYVMEDQGDMTGGRSYMQRGLRFCKQSRELWLEYAKLELLYIAKITARRRILGLDSVPGSEDPLLSIQEEDADHIALPATTAEDVDPSLRADSLGDETSLLNLDATPALSGAIPIAIFDAAMGKFHDAYFAEQFFNLTTSFETLSCSSKISKHIADALSSLDPTSPSSISCSIRQPLIGIQHRSPEFPVALGSVLKRINLSIEAQLSVELYEKAVEWLTSYLILKDLDSDIRTVIAATLSRIMSSYKRIVERQGGGSGDRVAKLLEQLRRGGLESMVSSMLPWSMETWPPNPRLLALQGSSSAQVLVPSQ